MNNVFDMAQQVLVEKDVDKKLTMSLYYAEMIIAGKVELHLNTNDVYDIKNVGIPERPELVPAKELVRRNIKTITGKAAMIHSFAHIEFNAINLAWDIICRFRDMPDDFYFDWTRVAKEETDHFVMLRKRLLENGYDYGDFPAHDGLWRMAEETAHDILIRLAVIPRIMEARGLDVTPDLINRFREIKDKETVSVLKKILKDEIGHVSLGSKWYRYICKKYKKDPDLTFKDIINQFTLPINSKNINKDARIMAGFTNTELEYLNSI